MGKKIFRVVKLYPPMTGYDTIMTLLYNVVTVKIAVRIFRIYSEYFLVANSYMKLKSKINS